MVRDHVKPGATLCTDDEAKAWQGMPEFPHEAVNHSARDCMRGQVHRNGLESFWAILKQHGDYGIYHKMSSKHLGKRVRCGVCPYRLPQGFRRHSRNSPKPEVKPWGGLFDFP